MSNLSDRLEITREVGIIAFRTSPGGIATAVTWGDFMGVVVGVLTAVFLVLQICHFVWKWRREVKRGQAGAA